LIGLLNAILRPQKPIVSMEILNPFNNQEFAEYDAARLRQLLPGIEFDQAIGVLETIASKTEDRLMYDQRERALRDHEWAISGARQEGEEIGMRKGEEKGGALGIVAGKIQLIQELLGDLVTPSEELLAQELPSLEAALVALQNRLRRREA
jgi:flagellar biosynthesis/type III secretory pathway protein FliH